LLCCQKTQFGPLGFNLTFLTIQTVHSEIYTCLRSLKFTLVLDI